MLIVAALAAANLFASADEEQLPEITIGKITATASDGIRNELHERAWCGAEEILRLDGKVFVTLKAVVDVAWSDELRQLRIDGSQIKLVDDRGNPCPELYRRFGNIKYESGGFYPYRPREWPDIEKAKPTVYEGTFVVPKGCREARLTLATASATVAIPQDNTPLPPLTAPQPGLPAKYMIFEILDARLIDERSSKVRISGETYTSTITNPQGKLLEVRLKFTPTRGNDPDDDTAFTWQTNHLGFRYGEDKFVVTAGEEFVDGVVAYVGGSRRSQDGKWETKEATVWFAVPENLDKGMLTYKTTPVAEITPGGPYKVLEVK
jgi:hypothetical protein